ncbi:uncharacterized protein LOC122673939 [Cervus elaphus]|uniref:uncharacterized protein LOC122673939 n=1 Tax=Cervus elaphus TaxID=9860 RepID=UPI001CC31008|nr:uncharacterized protein LOC122673939 [Cervus elaphus]
MELPGRAFFSESPVLRARGRPPSSEKRQGAERRPRGSLGRSSRSRNKNCLRHGLSEEGGQGGSVRPTGGEKGKDPALRLDRAADTEGTRRGPAEGRPLRPGRGRRQADIRGCRRPGYGRSRGAPGGEDVELGPELGSLLWSDAPLQGCGEGREGENRPQGFSEAPAPPPQPLPPHSPAHSFLFRLLSVPVSMVTASGRSLRRRPLYGRPSLPRRRLRAGMGDVLVPPALGPPPPGAGARSAAPNSSGPSLNLKGSSHQTYWLWMET